MNLGSVKVAKRSRLPELKDQERYVRALALSELATKRLREGKERLDRLEARSGRLHSTTRHFLSRGLQPCAGLDPHRFDNAALAAAELDGSAVEIFKKLGIPLNPVILQETADADDVRELLAQRGLVDLLTRGCELARAKLATEKSAALAEIARFVSKERIEKSNALALALGDLRASLDGEIDFCESLRAQDEELLKLIKPPMFPVALINGAAIASWLKLAAGSGKPDLASPEVLELCERLGQQ